MAEADTNELGSVPQYMIERIMEFQKSIPFVIGAVAIGVGTVNRTVLKSVFYLIFATLATLVAVWSKPQTLKTSLGVTAFLFASIAYVAMCGSMTREVDMSYKISIPIGFGILWFIDMYVTKITFGEFPYAYYIGTVILSAILGILTVLLLQAVTQDIPLLYDFKGCSCDDCANAHTCSVKPPDPDAQSNSNKTVVIGRIIKQ
jgi:hypothetical protein